MRAVPKCGFRDEVILIFYCRIKALSVMAVTIVTFVFRATLPRRVFCPRYGCTGPDREPPFIYSIRLIVAAVVGLYAFGGGCMGLSLSAPFELRSGSPTLFLRQALDFWPYPVSGVSVCGLAYLLLPAIW